MEVNFLWSQFGVMSRLLIEVVKHFGSALSCGGTTIDREASYLASEFQRRGAARLSEDVHQIDRREMQGVERRWARE